jgi:hypothetical protein
MYKLKNIIIIPNRQLISRAWGNQGELFSLLGNEMVGEQNYSITTSAMKAECTAFARRRLRKPGRMIRGMRTVRAKT